jgi:ABC-2 type transport system permease protein
MVFLIIIVFLIVGVGMYADYAIELVFPNLFSQTIVSMPQEMESYFEFEDTKYEVNRSSKANLTITEDSEGYTITADQTTNEQDIVIAKSWIEHYHRISQYSLISQEIVEEVDGLIFPNIIVDNHSVSTNEGGFILITMIYFLMLGFSSTVANEVVSEKTSNMLEMMLTSISYKEHYITKLLLGWLTILVQVIVWASVFTFWTLTRFLFDQGKGLYAMLYRLKVISKQYSSFIDHIQSLSFSLNGIVYIVLSVLFLMIGILMVQLILLLVSIKIENVEESASVQAPFYLIMLGLYYGILAINNYSHMQLGIGKILSFVPGFSMLLMPIRILFYEVNKLEILISLLFSGAILIVAYQLGLQYYRRNLMQSRK